MRTCMCTRLSARQGVSEGNRSSNGGRCVSLVGHGLSPVVVSASVLSFPHKGIKAQLGATGSVCSRKQRYSHIYSGERKHQGLLFRVSPLCALTRMNAYLQKQLALSFAYYPGTSQPHLPRKIYPLAHIYSHMFSEEIYILLGGDPGTVL